MALLVALLFWLLRSAVFGAIQYGACRLGGKRFLWGVCVLVSFACLAYFAAVGDLASAMIFLQSAAVALWPIIRIPLQKHQQFERAAEARWAAKADYRSGDQS